MKDRRPDNKCDKSIPNTLDENAVLELAKRKDSGDLKAREKLILSHLPLVQYLTKSYLRQCRQISYQDLYQQACCGLIEAVDRYDYRRGTKLSSYAGYYIIKYLNDLIRTQPQIPLSEEIYLLIQKFSVGRIKFFQEHGRLPSTQELSEYSGLNEDRIRKLQNFIYNFTSMDHCGFTMDSGASKPVSLHEFIPADKSKRPVENEALSSLDDMTFGITLGYIFVPLTKRETDILRRHLGMTKQGVPETFRAIAKDWNLTPAAIRLDYHNAIRKLRDAATNYGITADDIKIQ